MNNAEFSILYATFPNLDLGKKMANELITKRMGTFINIIPSMVTMYSHHKAKFTQKILKEQELDSEVLMLAKIRTSLAGEIIEYLNEKHPYDIPEIYTVHLDNVSPILRNHLDANLAERLNVGTGL